MEARHVKPLGHDSLAGRSQDGFIRTRDGVMDDRDKFHEAYPDDFVGEYDTRTMVAVSKNVLEVLLESFRRQK